MSNKLAIIQAATSTVSTDVRGYLSHGSLQLPADYSVENALKSAELMLPSVNNIQICTRESIEMAIRDMCVQGMNPSKKQCYFIAYGETLAMQRSYFGEIALAKRVDPTIEEIFPCAVYQGDEFTYEIKRGKIVSVNHKQKPENKKKAIEYVYATVVYRDGSERTTVMTMEQVFNAWKKSPSKPFDANGKLKPDSTHAMSMEEMALKTVTRKTCKPIINSSDDSTLLGQSIRQCADDTDAAEVDAEIAENANKQMIDVECIDKETGEITEPEDAPQKAREPF